MAYQRKTAETKKNEWKQVPDMAGFTVIGDRDRFSISFEVFDGFRIGINGCRVVTSAQHGDFISFPAWKGKDGSYHDHCYMTFSQEEQQKIIDTLA